MVMKELVAMRVLVVVEWERRWAVRRWRRDWGKRRREEFGESMTAIDIWIRFEDLFISGCYENGDGFAVVDCSANGVEVESKICCVTKNLELCSAMRGFVSSLELH